MDLKITKGEFNIPQKLLTSWAQRDKTLQETFTFADKSKSLLVFSSRRQLEKIKQPKSLLSRKEEVYVLREDEENVLNSRQRTNNATGRPDVVYVSNEYINIHMDKIG